MNPGQGGEDNKMKRSESDHTIETLNGRYVKQEVADLKFVTRTEDESHRNEFWKALNGMAQEQGVNREQIRSTMRDIEEEKDEREQDLKEEKVARVQGDKANRDMIAELRRGMVKDNAKLITAIVGISNIITVAILYAIGI